MHKLFKKFGVFNIVLCVFLFVYAFSMIYSIFWGFITSVKSIDEFRRNVIGLPHNWTFENYILVFNNFVVERTTESGTMQKVYIETQLLNSLIYVFGTCIMATLVPCITAYLCANFDYLLSKFVYGIVIVVMALPIIGAYPSELQILNALRLYDTWAGVFIQTGSFLGIYFLVFYSAFRGIPKDYAEAAALDGGSEWTILFRIMLPLAKNVILTVLLLNGVSFWNNYQAPLLYLPSRPTLSYGLYYIANAGRNEMFYVPPRMAGILLVILPILAIFFIFKDKMMENVSMGGIKG